MLLGLTSAHPEIWELKECLLKQSQYDVPAFATNREVSDSYILYNQGCQFDQSDALHSCSPGSQSMLTAAVSATVTTKRKYFSSLVP
jgi:hypothetical protein